MFNIKITHNNSGVRGRVSACRLCVECVSLRFDSFPISPFVLHLHPHPSPAVVQWVVG